MPFIEQLLYGHDHLAEAGGRQELAHSAGMGTEASAEIHALCDAWGQAPALGLQHPVLISHPLRSTMPSMRGRLYAVIRASSGDNPLFHAVVVPDAVFAACGRNPYALAPLVPFRDEWNGQRGLERLEIDPEDRPPLVEPPVGASDAGLIDEAVLAFLEDGRLQLPIEQSLGDSERALALMIACLPEKDRKELRFASFTTVKGHAYDLTALETEGAAFAGWRRLMMARLDTGATARQREYRDLMATHLKAGDLNAVMRTSQRHDFSEPRSVGQQMAMRTSPTPEPAPPRPAPARPRPAAAPSPIRPAATVETGRPRPGIRTAPRRDPLPSHGLDPAADSVRPRRASPFRPRVTSAFPGGRPGSGGRFLRLVTILLLIFVAGWVGTMWLEGRTLAESFEWAGLPGMDGWKEPAEHAGTVLEVPDVGRVYAGALKHAGGSGLGLNASGERGRRMALGELQEHATTPLFAQIELLGTLADEGIRSTDRPSREVRRLRTLAEQGDAMRRELDRLEMAWFSLTTGTNWHDLPRLSDKAVTARRDSLERAEPGALADVRLGLAVGDAGKHLDEARRRMGGMAALVELFQAPRWSPDWERELAAAAAKVPPSVGRTTRAYRNSAFALLRLKKAERSLPGRRLPFSTVYDPGEWPTPEVAEILPRLRKEAGRFADRTAPPLLAGTVGLYAALADPGGTIDRITGSEPAWRRLQENAAVRFDPEYYLDYLDRLRFEAALRRTRPHGDLDRIPAHLCPDADRGALAAFADSLTTLDTTGQWLAMKAATEDPFFRRWAGRLAEDMDARLALRRSQFEAAWSDCRTAVAALQADVMAGYDWSRRWRLLHATATGALADYGAELADDPTQSPRLDYLRGLVAALEAPRDLTLRRATIRLEPDRLAGPGEARLEILRPGRPPLQVSEPFRIGPAAPAGSGWVGTVAVDWEVPVGARDILAGRVVGSDGATLLEVTWPSLAQEGGPAAMGRPQEGTGGTIGFRADLDAYWGGLEVPDLGLVF